MTESTDLLNVRPLRWRLTDWRSCSSILAFRGPSV